MTEKELDRIQVLRNVLDKRISQKKASEVLKVSPRHIRRLMCKLLAEGPRGLISSKRGKVSNRSIPETIKSQAFKIIDEHYYDYGPTLIAEKLSERHSIHVGKETMRQWLISSGRRSYKQVKPKKVHQLRARRDCFGELIQIDGSIHRWFAGCEPCTLLVFIDDATSKLVELKFVEAETTLSYFDALKEYILKYGKPRAIYTDKHVVFKVNCPGGKQTNGLTQFGRALKQLGIEPIFAHSPQAKGRVERANNTLQDRLVKELRYFNITSIKEANKFLQQYINEYNKKFAIQPKNDTNLHIQVTNREQVMLDKILSIQTTRHINKNLTIKHNNVSYLIINVGKGHRYINSKATVCEKSDGSVDIICRGKILEHLIYAQAKYKPNFADRKNIDQLINKYHFLTNSKINRQEGYNYHG